MDYLLGIDLGTSGVKTVVFDTKGTMIASAERNYPLYQPQNGWAEQDPALWWAATVEVLQEVLAGIPAERIQGIGLAGQMHGLVMLDEQGEVLRNCILWCDGRTGEECKEITKRIGQKRLLALAANPALPGFTAGKLLWVRRHEPEIYKACRTILLPKDYIRYRLTGVLATEVSDASGTNLLDVARRCWSKEIAEALDIPLSLLPPVVESVELTGGVTAAAALLTGLRMGTPVVGGAGDNAAAAVGSGVVQSGRAFTTLGTSGVIFAHTDRVLIDPAGRVHTFCHAVPGCWTTMSCTLAAGLSLQWFKEIACGEEKAAALALDRDIYALLEVQAMRSPIGANRLLYLPYLMGERSPILDEQARGAFLGLSASHEKADMLRAVMEGVAYSQRQCLDVLRELGISFSEMIVCGGGGKSAFWRQMLADLYGCPVNTIASCAESAALGAALLAGVGTGIYTDVPSACAAAIQTGQAQWPEEACASRYEAVYQLFCSAYPALKDTFWRLSKLPVNE